MLLTEEKNQTSTSKKPSNLKRTGILLIVFSILFLLWIFYPAILEEGKYYFGKKNQAQVVTKKEADALPADQKQGMNILEPIDENFGIIVPKIYANSKVIADVDPGNSAVYQRALTKGVAHAKGTSYPGEAGNVFIFAHSGLDFYEASRYNAVFYLLNKMEKGDDIYIFYQGQKLQYKVADTKVVGAWEVQYFEDTPGQKTLTLMTCWPAGTDWKRLVVVGEQVD